MTTPEHAQHEAAADSAQQPAWPLFAAKIVVVLFPALVGSFHLLVHPLVPYRGDPSVSQPASAPGQSEEMLRLQQERHALGMAANHRAAVTFPLVFLACMVASIAVGMLGYKHWIGWALILAFISTVAHTLHDGQGACGAPFFALLPFWPLMGLGKFISALLSARS